MIKAISHSGTNNENTYACVGVKWCSIVYIDTYFTKVLYVTLFNKINVGWMIDLYAKSAKIGVL